MNLEGKKVWDLSSEEIDYVYRERHMNNYVYAALRTFHDSPMPLNRKLSVRPESVPACLREPADRLLEISPYLGNDDPKNIRVHYTYRAFELFKALGEVKPEELEATLGLLASLAYIPIVAEKNDSFPLWWHPVVRKRDAHIETLFADVLAGRKIETYIEDCLWAEEPSDMKARLRTDPAYVALVFPPRVAQSIIVMNENGLDPVEISRAWRNLEAEMVRFEAEHGLRGGQFLGNMRAKGQIRYRNTVYLYAGDHFRRQADPEALSWYMRDILTPDLPKLFGFYLTDMKTMERILCARTLPEGERAREQLDPLVATGLLQVFRNAARYAEDTFRFFAKHPDADPSAGRLQDPESGGYRLYGGEGSREPFFTALLYHHLVRRRRFADLDYAGFFNGD
jgi:hypothetical protein